MKYVQWALVAVLLLVVALFVAGQLGLLRGKAPSDLGVREGRLKAPSNRPNNVSSQAGLWPAQPQAQAAAIAPLALLPSGGMATIARLREILAATPGTVVVEARGDYLYAQCSTRWLKFSDDLELWLDPAAGVVQVRSASRLGESDMGVNRQRVEALRAALVGGAGR